MRKKPITMWKYKFIQTVDLPRKTLLLLTVCNTTKQRMYNVQVLRYFTSSKTTPTN